MNSSQNLLPLLVAFMLLWASCSDTNEACSPLCPSGAQCGDDGCGGQCGSCGTGQSCVDHHCQGGCLSDCPGGAECGDDGCGGICGVCDLGLVCQDFRCVSSSCVPTCSPQDQCGDDGCGGQCGVCSDDEACADRRCLPRPDMCGGVEAGCQGNVLVWCEGEQVRTMNCEDQNLQCGYLEAEGAFACLCACDEGFDCSAGCGCDWECMIGQACAGDGHDPCPCFNLAGQYMCTSYCGADGGALCPQAFTCAVALYANGQAYEVCSPL